MLESVAADATAAEKLIANIVAAMATMSTAVNAHIAAEWERWIVSTVTERDISRKKRTDISH